MSSLTDSFAFVTQGTGADMLPIDPTKDRKKMPENRPKTGETGPNPRP
jgi:hypothetical protein